MPAMSTFLYQPLAHASDIRLICVHSADQFEDPIHFNMQHCKTWGRQRVQLTEVWNNPYRLEDQEGYKAMSYAWGTDTTTEVATVTYKGKAQSLSIRRNVSEMLRHLRFSRHHKAGNEQWLWIDSICINQDELNEKESQVRMMGEIFACATLVLVWLGPRDAHAFDNDPEFNRRYLDPMVCDLSPSPELIRRSWFHRRWVIQEVGLAREAYVMCGTSSCEFQQFVRDAEHLTESPNDACTSVATTDKAVLQRLRSMANLQLSCREMFLPRGLTDLLLSFSDARCSDEHDILYALNSLSMESLPICYQRPVEDVYMDFAYKEATREPSILLSIAGAHPSSSDSLPSWTPDWRESPLYRPSTSRCFDSAYRSRIKWNQIVSLEEKVLTLMGSKIDEVATVSPCQGLETWMNFYVSQHDEPKDETIPGLTLMKTFTRGRSHLYRLSTDQHAKLFQLLAQGSSDADKSDSSTPKFARIILEKARVTMLGRTCFITKCGAFGMGPERIQLGDILVRIPDSPGLTALRPLNLSSSGHSVHEPVHYTLVGDCHVPKLVRGRDEELPTLEKLQPFQIA